MNYRKLATHIPFFPILILASPTVGWFIPAFYEWTNSDQSRPSPLLWKVPLSSAIASLVLCTLLPWLTINRKEVEHQPGPSMRFSLRTLMILATAIAVAIPLLKRFPLATSGSLCAGTYLYLVVFSVRHPQHRIASGALFSCMVLPFSWILGYGELERILPAIVVMIGGLPAFIPAALLGHSLGQHFQDSRWLALLLSSFELLLGIWLIQLGPKRSIAYLLLVMHLSYFGSLAFYQLCIA